MSSEMVKRVAQTIFSQTSPGIPYLDEDKEQYEAIAVEVIKSMHNAPSDMQNIYYQMARKEGYSQFGACFNIGTWERLIDASLKE